MILSAKGNAKLFEELVKVSGEPDLVPTLNQNDMPWDFSNFLDLGEDPVDTLSLKFRLKMIITYPILDFEEADPKDQIDNNGNRLRP